MSLLRTIAFSLVLAGLSPLALAQAPLAPSADLDPPEVVASMLSALKKNSDEGIAELYSFSSPENRERTGPLASFEQLIRQGFPDLLGHRDARMAPPLMDQGRAMIPVQVQTSTGEMSEYIFLLSQQSIPECDGCWMADAVFSPEALQGPSPGLKPSQEQPGENPA